VNLVAKLEMPPKTGKIVQYIWTVDGTADTPTNVAAPVPLVNVNRTMTFDKPGTYTIRLTVNGQRDGLLDPPNQTLLENFQEVRVVVQ
jgi:urease beta subunit